MKVVKLKRSVKIIPESVSDVRLLSKIIKIGDIVKAEATRSIELGGKKVRKKIIAEIEVEKSKFEPPELRLVGRILNEIEDVPKGSYQSVEISEGRAFCLCRELSAGEKRLIDRAMSRQEPVLIVLIDDKDAEIYRYDGKAEAIAEFHASSRKEINSARHLSDEVVEFLSGREEPIIIAGPGFEKDRLASMLKGKRAVSDSVSHLGPPGVREVLARKLISRLTKQAREEKEAEIVEKFFTELAKDGLVAYGYENVRNLVKAGAVSLLIASESMASDQLLDEAEKTGAEVELVSEEHEAGKRLRAFGGVAAFLRYRL